MGEKLLLKCIHKDWISVSDTIPRGNPQSLTKMSRNNLATILAVNPVLRAPKCALLVNRSTIAIMLVHPIEEGKLTIKSIVFSDHGLVGIGRGCNKP